MFIHQEEKTLSHEIDDLKKLILDVESYPEFLPWCEKVEILQKNRDGFEADLILKYKSFKKSYISKTIITESGNMVIIKTTAMKGIFKSLNSIWELKKIDPEQTIVKFRIHFELQSAFFSKILNLFFKTANQKMMQSFEKRIGQLCRK